MVRKLALLFLSVCFIWSCQSEDKGTGIILEVPDPECGDGTIALDPGVSSGYGRMAMTNRVTGGPTDIAFIPNSSDYLVTTQIGDIHYFTGGCEAANVVNLPDLELPVRSGGEQGLLNIELHPDWLSNKLAFVYHTSSSSPTNSISRIRLDIVNGELQISNPVRVIDFRKTSSAGNHNGGGLVFAPDKSLLASVGDGGNAENGQTDNDLLGAVIRIMPDLTSNTEYSYTIPSGNMFNSDNPKCYDTSDSPQPCPELLAIGLRNPFRMSIDGNTVYLGEVGTSFEEINRFNYRDNDINFGWSSQDGPGGGSGFTDPILSYERSRSPATSFRDADPACGSCNAESASIMTGPIYRGSRYGGKLSGHLIWGEFYQGFVRSVDGAGVSNGLGNHLIHQNQVSSYVTGPDGYIYFAAMSDGIIYRLMEP